MNLALNCRYLLWFPLLCQRPVLPWCLTLSVDAASNQACCKQHVCLSTGQRSISSRKNSYSKKRRTSLVLISGRAQNSPDLNLVDYNVWGVVQQRVHECRMNSVNELKLHLIDVWNSLQQNIIDTAINEWRKQLRACVHADRQHFQHLLWACVCVCVCDKSYV